MIRPRRSLLFMPGSNARALEKGRNLPADGLILDLRAEDVYFMAAPHHFLHQIDRFRRTRRCSDFFITSECPTVKMHPTTSVSRTATS